MPLDERPYKARRQWVKRSESIPELRSSSASVKENSSYLSGTSSRSAIFHPGSEYWDDGRAWSFASGLTEMANGKVEGETKSGDGGKGFDFETVETGKSWSTDNKLPVVEGFIVDDTSHAPVIPPQTAQALRSLSFLKQHLSSPFNTIRLTPTPIETVHKRHHSIASVCKEWIRCVNGAEINGMKLLIGPLHRFFQSGQVLTWIEVMAATQQLHKLVEIVKDLRVWLGRAKTVGQTPELEEKLEVIKAWTVDLEFATGEYAPCLSAFPNEIYFISPTFLPQNSRLRQQLSVMASQRHEPLPVEFISRTEREPYKIIRFPRAVVSDPSFSAEDVNRFTFSPKGSLIAFRGRRQVIIFSAYTSAIFCTFHFPKREPAFVAFSPGSTMLAVSFSSTESRLLDLRTGRIIQEVGLRDRKLTVKAALRRSKSISLGKDAKKLYTQHKSHDVGSELEQLNFAATYLDERTSAVGPQGVHALLTADGVFKVSDEDGNTLFFRRIMLEGGTPKSPLQRSITALKRTWSGHSSGRGKGEDKKLKSLESNSTRGQSFNGIKSDFALYKCYDIGTHEAEDVAFSKLSSQYNTSGGKSLEPELNISFNLTGTVAILHTTNAFGANLDLLHIANYSAKENPSLHLVYSTTPQPIRAFSASSDGDLIALAPQNLVTVTILRLSQRQAIYNLYTAQISLTPLIGLSFVPAGQSTLMTAHSGGHATFWDLTRLSEGPESIRLLDPQLSISDEGHKINATGKVVLLNRLTSKGCAPCLLRTEDVQSAAVATTIRFSRSIRCPQAIALADDGNFLTIGKYLYSLSPKNKRKKISLPDKSHVVISTISSYSKLAVALLLPTLQSQVRILNRSMKMGDWIAPAEVLNIWGLAFSKDETHLAVGVQLRSDGLDKFAICMLAKREKGLQEIGRTLEWESMKPVRLSFPRNDKLVVLVSDRDRGILSWSTLTFKVPSGSTAVEVPVVVDFMPHEKVFPDMTLEGDVFYLGDGAEEGWLMRLGVDKEEAEKVSWCPSSWWSVGSLSILSARKGNLATVVFVNTIMGIAAAKLQTAE